MHVLARTSWHATSDRCVVPLVAKSSGNSKRVSVIVAARKSSWKYEEGGPARLRIARTRHRKRIKGYRREGKRKKRKEKKKEGRVEEMLWEEVDNDYRVGTMRERRRGRDTRLCVREREKKRAAETKRTEETARGWVE